jgi:DNA-binding HxlR family transcriptional regulator
MHSRTAPRLVDTSCPVTRSLVEHVTSKWGVLVLLELADGPRRWSGLKRAISGVSEKMLISTLQTLEADRLVDRHALPVVPPHVEYSLTADGREASRLLEPLVAWAARQAGQQPVQEDAAASSPAS